VYVYYRVVGDHALARDAVAAMMADLEGRTGVCGRLLRRCDDDNTWMEVFAPVREIVRFNAALEACEVQHRLAGCAEHGRRHRECFVAVASSPAR
jgi:hypothetical protein